ncbi:MAG: tRNA (guanosine(46)-N7)-methyltransferase TrmB [Chlamydiales bacterium]|nr:tRNA (guanosine(46)-N7)-methyltransferase TrmB [Chlamydiales bacterium]
MRPKDLKSPFTWNTRHVTVCDRVWYVPEHCPDYEAFSFSGWHSEQFFGNSNPVIVEYCCGNGHWIEDKAKLHPQRNWLGVEIKFERVRKVWSKIQNNSLPNLMVACGEALKTTQLYMPTASVDEVYVNFPDPWPKTRHTKNRLLQGEFLQELRRILRLDGTITVATDDPGYSNFLIKQFLKAEGFESAYPEPHYINDWPGYGDSYFDALWRAQGKQIRYHRYLKKG